MAFTQIEAAGITSTSTVVLQNVSISGVITASQFVGDSATLNKISANNSLGSVYNVLSSTGSAIQWVDLNTIVTNVQVTTYNYLTLDTSTSTYGTLYQYSTNTSSNDSIDLSSTDVYSQFTTTGTSTLSINSNGYLVLTI